MINVGDKIKCTEFGDAMARYYVKFETMKGLLSLEPRAKMSDIVSPVFDIKDSSSDWTSCRSSWERKSSATYASKPQRRSY